MFKLFVNQEDLNFQLENEEILGEFYHSLERLFSYEALLMTDFLVDGKNYFQEDLSEKKLSEIKEIRVNTQKVSEFCFEVLSDAKTHIEGLLKSFDEGKTYEKIESLKESIAYLKSIVTQSLLIYPNYDKSIKEDLRLLEIEVFEVESKENYKSKKDLLKNYPDLFSALLIKVDIFSFYVYTNYFLEVLREGDFNKSYLKIILPLIEIFINKISISQTEIATCFQTGKDKLANLWLIPFLDAVSLIGFFLEKIATHADFKENKTELDALKKKVKEHLEELSSSFYDKNYVAINDLIEYELKEDFEELLTFLKNFV